MGHSLKALPPNNIEHFKSMDLQCTKCGCVFLVNVNNRMADFLINCDLEQKLREDNTEGAAERPILVKES